MRQLISTVIVLALGLAISGAENQLLAQIAQTKPLKIDGDGLILEDFLFAPGATAVHVAIGRGTAGLGRYFGFGEARVDNPATGEFSSNIPFRFVKFGNGDTLACQYGRTDPESGASPPAQTSGMVMLLPAGGPGMVKAVFLAEFNPVPLASTGKFEDVVAGSLTMLAETEPFVLGFTNDPQPIPFVPAFTPYSWSGTGTIEFEK